MPIRVKSRAGNSLSAYFYQACRDAGAGRDDGLETAVVHHEVTNWNNKKKKVRILF